MHHVRCPRANGLAKAAHEARIDPGRLVHTDGLDAGGLQLLHQKRWIDEVEHRAGHAARLQAQRQLHDLPLAATHFHLVGHQHDATGLAGCCFCGRCGRVLFSPDQGQQLAGLDVGIEILHDGPTGRFGQPCAQWGIAQQAGHGIGQFGGVARAHQQAVLFVMDQFRNAGNPRGNGRGPAGHGFHQRDRNAIGIAVGQQHRGQHEQGGPVDAGANLLLWQGAGQPYLCLQAGGVDGLLQRVAQWPVADDVAGEGRAPFLQQPACLHQMDEALDGIQPPDAHDVRRLTSRSRIGQVGRQHAAVDHGQS